MRRIIGLLVATGLGIEAYIHFDLAARYAPVSNAVSQATLFRVEGAVAILVALTVLIRPTRLSFAVAGAVAASGLGAVLLYRYVNVGELGPLPNMYEPIWFTQKTLSAIAESVALVASAIGLLLRSEPRAR